LIWTSASVVCHQESGVLVTTMECFLTDTLLYRHFTLGLESSSV